MSAAARRSPGDVRNDIVSAAWDLFRQLGVHTTIADVAERLGMSSANIYRFFPSKQALTDAVCASQLAALTEAARAAANRLGPGQATRPGDDPRPARCDARADAPSSRGCTKSSTSRLTKDGRRSTPLSPTAPRCSPLSSPMAKRAENSDRGIRRNSPFTRCSPAWRSITRR